MSRTVRLAALIALVVVAGFAGRLAAGALPGRGDPLVGPVVRVVDGDTLHVALAAGERTVRVIGIDTPEIRHGDRPGACFGPEAAGYARRTLTGRRVRLTLGIVRTDRYGRTLATVQIADGPLAGSDLSTLLARDGYARPLPIPPNTANAGAIAGLVTAARTARRGLWGACSFASAFPGKG